MSLPEALREPGFEGYTYGYPHKTAYRPLTPPRDLREVWAGEARDALFLYLHVPYCEQRCGFCNLFTLSKEGDPGAYLQALKRQASVVSEAIGEARYARIAIGGGTPTFLEPRALEALFAILRACGADPRSAPTSCETSPQTATPERLAVLAEAGVERVSMGVQSFDEAENRALGRAQTRAEVHRAIANMRDAGFDTVNLDFIYGGRGQTDASWLAALREAVELEVEEVFLYPLYVRALTGLGRSRKSWDDERVRRYRAGRDFLRERGYRQLSMRMFRKEGHLAGRARPVYRCTEDGMVGLGAGARSYTRGLHYSSEYAVGRSGVKAILEDYIGRSDGGFRRVDYGIELDADEQARRALILGLLSDEGLPRGRFDDSPEVEVLLASGMAREVGGVVKLSEEGMTRSDVIGPWLYSPRVRALSADYDLR